MQRNLFISTPASGQNVHKADKCAPTPHAYQTEKNKLSEVINTQDIKSELHNSLIQKLFEEYHLWTLHSSEEYLPDNINNSREQLITEFLKGFFAFDKACSEQLKIFTCEFIEKLNEFIPNLPFSREEFCAKMIDEYNIYHSENESLQNEITLEILSLVKDAVIVNEIYHRSVLSDLYLSDKEQIFLEKVFVSRIFNSEIFLYYYFKYLKCFIEGYTKNTEKLIKDLVESSMKHFSDRLLMIRAEAKRKVYEITTEFLNKVNYVRISVYLSQLSELPNSREVVYEFFANKEEVNLQQVVQLSPGHVLITIHLVQSKSIIFISYNTYRTTRLNHPFTDDKIVIASGSTIDSIIIFQNTLKKAKVACMGLKNISLSKGLKIYSDSTTEVISACYIECNNEILFINSQGGLGQFSLRLKAITPLSQVTPSIYRKIQITDCKRFIILLSKRELYLFSFQMILMYVDHTCPHIADVKDKALYFFFFENESNVTIRSIAIDSEHMIHTPYSCNTFQKIDAKIARCDQFVYDIFNGLFQKRNFRKISVPDVKPR